MIHDFRPHTFKVYALLLRLKKGEPCQCSFSGTVVSRVSSGRNVRGLGFWFVPIKGLPPWLKRLLPLISTSLFGLSMCVGRVWFQCVRWICVHIQWRVCTEWRKYVFASRGICI